MKGKLVTVFGGSGFIGRHLVQRLAASGARVRVAVRHPRDAHFLQPMGDVGQIAAVPASVTRKKTIPAAMAGADAVVNLVGILYQSGWRRSFRAVHYQGAGNVAHAAREAGVERLVHMSALGADPKSRAKYARTKAAGEEAVRKAFPEASIVRPSVVFGPQDGFFNLFASMARFSPFLPLIGGGHTKFQPVYVGDVADAIMKCLADPGTDGQTYELGGPTVYSFREILELIMRETGRERILLPLPFWLASLEATFLQLLPNPLLTRDQVKLLKHDNVVSGDLPTLADLGIEATAAETIIPTYLDRYRRGGRFSRIQRA